jgi:1,4-dihydroxy-2-naphthoate octaprenyltransferase
VPVVVGVALAGAAGGPLDWAVAAAALLGALAIQVATNLLNDAADFQRGADGPDRLGPPRATAQGWLAAGQVRRGGWLCFAVAALAGLYLVAVGGWPILALGVLSILAGWAYTGGPRPIAYTPLGEVFVIAFFGIGAVAGTVWLLAGRVDSTTLTGGLAVGSFAAAVLLTNNHRDRVADARAGRHTLALVCGPSLSAWLYGAFMLAPFVLLAPLQAELGHGRAWLALGALPPALRLAHRFSRVEGRGYNGVLGATAKAQLLYGVLLCLGLAAG